MPNHLNARIVAKAFARSLLKLTNGLKSALSLSIIIGFSGAALGQSPEPDWRVGWRNTIQAAQKEGKVVVSIPASAELRQALEEGFKRQFPGISQELFPAQGANNINRIFQEDKGGVHYFDVHIGGTSSIITGLLPAGLLEPLIPWLILPEVKKPKNWWGGHIWADTSGQYIYMFLAYLTETLWYNMKELRPEEVRSYDDLLKPKLKGRIEILDPRTPGSGRLSIHSLHSSSPCCSASSLLSKLCPSIRGFQRLESFERLERIIVSRGCSLQVEDRRL